MAIGDSRVCSKQARGVLEDKCKQGRVVLENKCIYLTNKAYPRTCILGYIFSMIHGSTVFCSILHEHKALGDNNNITEQGNES